MTDDTITDPTAAVPAQAALPRRTRRLRRSLVALGVVVSAAVAAGGGYTLYVNNQITRLTVGGLSGSGSAADGTENILLVGSTSR